MHSVPFFEAETCFNIFSWTSIEKFCVAASVQDTISRRWLIWHSSLFISGNQPNRQFARSEFQLLQVWRLDHDQGIKDTSQMILYFIPSFYPAISWPFSRWHPLPLCSMLLLTVHLLCVHQPSTIDPCLWFGGQCLWGMVEGGTVSPRVCLHCFDPLLHPFSTVCPMSKPLAHSGHLRRWFAAWARKSTTPRPGQSSTPEKKPAGIIWSIHAVPISPRFFHCRTESNSFQMPVCKQIQCCTLRV